MPIPTLSSPGFLHRSAKRLTGCLTTDAHLNSVLLDEPARQVLQRYQKSPIQVWVVLVELLQSKTASAKHDERRLEYIAAAKWMLPVVAPVEELKKRVHIK